MDLSHIHSAVHIQKIIYFSLQVSGDDLEAELEKDLGDLDLGDVDTDDVNLDDNDLLQDF